MSDINSPLSSSVFRVHRRPGDGVVRRVPAAELGAEAGGAAGDDRHLLAADRSFLHLAVRSLRHRPPQHRVSVCHMFNTVMTVFILLIYESVTKIRVSRRLNIHERKMMKQTPECLKSA